MNEKPIDIAQILLRIRAENHGPIGVEPMATSGEAIRKQLMDLIEQTETRLNRLTLTERVFGKAASSPRLGWAIGFSQDRMFVHPQLAAAIKGLDLRDQLELALSTAFPTKASAKHFNTQWPLAVERFRGEANDEEAVALKACALALFIVFNSDVGGNVYDAIREKSPELHRGALSDDQVRITSLEEAALWYRVMDELAHRYLGKLQHLFSDHLTDALALLLSLQGNSPERIVETMVARSHEYGSLRKWIADENERPGGTLLWEAAKRVGQPLGCHANLWFASLFPTAFLKRLQNASVNKLLTGQP